MPICESIIQAGDATNAVTAMLVFAKLAWSSATAQAALREKLHGIVALAHPSASGGEAGLLRTGVVHMLESLSNNSSTVMLLGSADVLATLVRLTTQQPVEAAIVAASTLHMLALTDSLAQRLLEHGAIDAMLCVAGGFDGTTRHRVQLVRRGSDDAVPLPGASVATAESAEGAVAGTHELATYLERKGCPTTVAEVRMLCLKAAEELFKVREEVVQECALLTLTLP